MGQRFQSLSIEKLGIIGSGQIGPDIALHFAKALLPRRVPIVVVDIAPAALAAGQKKLSRKIAKGVESGSFKPEAAQMMLDAVTFTGDDEQLRGASLIVEAATEDEQVKLRIFERLESVCGLDTILVSNSSHLEPERIFARLQRKERSLVVHYFFPAERNPLVEIVPGPATDPALTAALMAFYESIGKVPIRVASRYGYAVDPVFEGLFLAAALAVEEGLGTTREVDAAARRALGLGVGPFTAMNLTGGNPLTNHGLDEMHARGFGWYKSPQLLKEAVNSGQPWDAPGKDDAVELPPAREQQIGDTLRGAYFGIAGEIVDSGIVSLADLELAIEIGLVMKPPFRAMNELGLERALALVESYAARHPGFVVPRCLSDHVRSGTKWRIDQVQRRDDGDVAVFTIRRPAVLNALNEDVYAELQRHFEELRADTRVRAVVLTGFGPKAFVSGADVNFLARIETPEQGFASAESSKAVGNLIENLGKPVICAMNGSAIGGGNELAMCCTARICKKGLAVAAAQPEVNLGIIPGAGATQRLPRLIGLERAASLLRTGGSLSSREAVETGLVREEVEGDIGEAAIRLARDAANGVVQLAGIAKGPLTVPVELPPVDLEHLSRPIDAILCRAIIDGCRLPLADGLRHESQMFAECCRTTDMRLGLRNFLTAGPRSKAEFTHT